MGVNQRDALTNSIRNFQLLIPRISKAGSSTLATTAVTEVADENNQDGAICGAGRKELMAFRLCEKAHGCREEQCEYDQDANSVESGIAIPNRGELVHSYNRKHEEDEDDECDNHPNKLLDARLGIIVEAFIVRLLTKLFSREQFLNDGLVTMSE